MGLIIQVIKLLHLAFKLSFTFVAIVVHDN
jgi:hypothetical protein